MSNSALSSLRIALDLKNPKGQTRARRLSEKADVHVEYFKIGGMAKFGLDYESLSKTNPGLIYRISIAPGL